MNRRTLLPAVLAASLLAAACGPADDDSDATDNTAFIDETAATEPEPADVADVAEPASSETEPIATETSPEPEATAPAATEPAPPPSEPTTTEAAPEPPAAPTFEPFAIIDVGSTGGGNFNATELAPALVDSQIVGMLIPNAGSVVANNVTFETNEFPAADGGVQHGSNFRFTTQVTTDMALPDILAAYQAALDGVDGYEYAMNESTNDTLSQVGLQATGDGASGRLPQIIISVVADSGFPGIAQIEVRRIHTAPGEMPLPAGAAAIELAEPVRIDAENDIDVTQWSYDLSYSNFALSGTSRTLSTLYRFNLGEGTPADVPGLVESTETLFGPPAEKTEIGDNFIQLEYGDFGDPIIDVQLVPSSNEYLQVTWRLQRDVEVDG